MVRCVIQTSWWANVHGIILALNHRQQLTVIYSIHLRMLLCTSNQAIRKLVHPQQRASPTDQTIILLSPLTMTQHRSARSNGAAIWPSRSTVTFDASDAHRWWRGVLNEAADQRPQLDEQTRAQMTEIQNGQEYYLPPEYQRQRQLRAQNDPFAISATIEAREGRPSQSNGSSQVRARASHAPAATRASLLQELRLPRVCYQVIFGCRFVRNAAARMLAETQDVYHGIREFFGIVIFAVGAAGDERQELERQREILVTEALQDILARQSAMRRENAQQARGEAERRQQSARVREPPRYQEQWHEEFMDSIEAAATLENIDLPDYVENDGLPNYYQATGWDEMQQARLAAQRERRILARLEQARAMERNRVEQERAAAQRRIEDLQRRERAWARERQERLDRVERERARYREVARTVERIEASRRAREGVYELSCPDGCNCGASWCGPGRAVSYRLR